MAALDFYSTDDLEGMPTLCEGQADDLKVDTGDTRYWLSRCGVEDGEPFQSTVTIEWLNGGRWIEVCRYDGDDPDSDLSPRPMGCEV